MTKKNIVIVGYPKSGTTWAARLIAELVKCPLAGDWGYEHIDAPYGDGRERKSVYQCFKSHHTYDELYKVSELNIYKIIYIVRDPRDIAISGSHYFSFSFSWLSFLSKRKYQGLDRFFRRIANKMLPITEKRRQMINAVLNGDERINRWLKVPWEQHYQDYQNRNILFITYEKLLETPEEECHKIMKYLKLETTRLHIRTSIEKQNFKRLKKEVQNQDDKQLKKLFRQGSSGYWQKEFRAEEHLKFKNVLLNDYEFYTF